MSLSWHCDYCDTQEECDALGKCLSNIHDRVAQPWNLNTFPRRHLFDSLWIKIPAAIVLFGGALYFLGHIVAAWMRGSFGGWR